MQLFYDCSLDLTQAKIDLMAFKTLLDSKVEIGETELQDLFDDHVQLIWLMGKVAGIPSPKKFNSEGSIFRKYRTDFIITNSDCTKISFIEFEEAKFNSIFNTVKNKASVRFDWSSTFEHGVSQVTDWFYLLSENNGTDEMENEFCCRKIKYQGVVIAGRDKSIPNAEQRNRLDWRIENTVVNSKRISFYTFDSLFVAMKEQFDIHSGADLIT